MSEAEATRVMTRRPRAGITVHADRVDPQRADRCDGIRGADERIVVRCGDGDAGSDGDAEGGEKRVCFLS